MKIPGELINSSEAMKTIKSLMLFAAAAMAFAGCSKDDGTTNDMGVKVRFTAGADQTRTTFGDPDGTTYPTLWQEGDKIALRLNTSTSKIDCTVTPTNGGANATFDAVAGLIRSKPCRPHRHSYPRLRADTGA